ncbi:MAG TPA: hypothetical protein VK507_19370 [Iamia sp.]|nr:hypothetical protein [Iamia sp.]
MALSRPQEAIVSAFEQAHDTYSLYSSSLETLAARLCALHGLQPEITSRTKRPQSLRGKLERKSYAALTEVPDLSGVRVIVQYRPEVSAVCDLLHREFDVLDDDAHEADRPDAFGYASRHLVLQLDPGRAALAEWSQFRGLRAEVQVRTILQHAWASISHSLDYKHGEDVPSDVRRKLFQVAAMIEVSDGLFQDFRREVGEITDSYEQKTEAGDWRGLPIDVDALRVSFAEWRPRGIEALATAAEDLFATVSDSEHSAFLGQVASLSRSLQLGTVGDLADLMNAETTTDLFEARFRPAFGRGLGGFSLDYLALVTLTAIALDRQVDIDSDVEVDRHLRSVS